MGWPPHIRSPQDTLLAQPLALKEMVAAKQEQKDQKVKGATTFENLRLRAGQTVPGGLRSTLHLAQGELGRDKPRGWYLFGRQKLGVDNSSVWNRL